jgi:hypothetical protein
MWYLTFIGPHCVSWTTAVFCTIRVPHASHKGRLSLFHNTFIIGPHAAFQDHDHVHCQKSWVNTISCSIRLGKVLLSWCAIVECSLYDFGQCRHCWASSNHSWGKTKQAARHCMQLYSLNNCKKCSKFCSLQYHPLLDHSFSAKRYQLISFLCWNSHWLSILLHSFGSKGTEDQLQPFQLRAVFTRSKCAWHVPCPSHPMKR